MLNLVSDALQNCRYEYPSKFPGMVRVLPPDELTQCELELIPGAWTYEDPKGIHTGLYVAWNYILMGRLGATLADYPIHPMETTPYSNLHLMDHQRRSISFLIQATELMRGGILAAWTGAGKTVMSLQSLYLRGLLAGRGVIIAPKQAVST